MNIGHEAPLRVGKLIAVFCSCPCPTSNGTDRTNAITTVTRFRFAIVILSTLHLDFKKLLRIVFEDHFLFRSAQEVKAFDNVSRLIEPLSGFRILHSTNARPLRSEQATICTDGLEEQCQ